jgi:hypothetical protein
MDYFAVQQSYFRLKNLTDKIGTMKIINVKAEINISNSSDSIHSKLGKK